MGKVDYKAIYEENKSGWRALTEDPQKYEALLSGHYSDSNHFIYELIQNAEDAYEKNSQGVFDPVNCAYANKVVIEYYPDRLVFYHNGKPFDHNDVRGVSSMLMGTKDRDDAQTIGRFGMGFKSVFKYTYQPEIYSDDVAFKLTKYLLPVEVTGGWNPQKEKSNLTIQLNKKFSIFPFQNEKHLTKIVIPFTKYGKTGELVKISGKEVLEKLKELNGEILLFLTRIKSIYWVNRNNGEYAYIRLREDEEDKNKVICQISGSAYGEKEEKLYYLKFKRVFDHKDMKNAEVSIAYKLNSRADNINEVTDSPIWVYFPTREQTSLPFLIHGSFETAVSREKLMRPSPFNTYLFNELASLIADSMKALAERKLITQMFLRHVVIAAFEDERLYRTIPGLKNKITASIKTNGLLPDKNGNYKKPNQMKLPVPFRLSEFGDKPIIGKAIQCDSFVAFNNEKEDKFSAYYSWLVDDLKVPLLKLSNVAQALSILEAQLVTSTDGKNAITSFYDFLSENLESFFTTGLTYSRSGPYEEAIKDDISLAWKRLRKAPIILNQTDHLVPAYVDKKPNVYLGSSSKYKSIMQSELVNPVVAKKYSALLSEGFQIKEFDNFQYVKEKVIQKYIDIGDSIEFADNDNFGEEYAEDINQIIDLLDSGGDVSSIREMLEEAYIIKIRPRPSEENVGAFVRPRGCYIPVSDDGVNLNVYYSPVINEVKGDDEGWYDFDLSPIDTEFYEKNGIPISKIAKLGLVTTPVDEGNKKCTTGTGYYYWIALGEYCPCMKIDGLEDNITYIHEHHNSAKAKEKSAEVLKLLLNVTRKMKGIIRRKKTNPYEEESQVGFLSTIMSTAWLFDKEMKLLPPLELSRYDLNRNIYNVDFTDKEAFDVLGFVHKDFDETEETIHRAQSLNDNIKRRLVCQLAKDLGLQFSDASNNESWDGEADTSVFDPNAWVDDEFPVRRIANLDYLTRHVKEQFICADPITYSKVWRQIRTSKNSKVDNAYTKGMYTNNSNVTICQSCMKPAVYPEVAQISNFGIEMPQLNLCFCRECYAKYKTICNYDKDKFKSKITLLIQAVNLKEDRDDYSLEIDNDFTLHFTQTHLAEIQVILNLLSEYGIPDRRNADRVLSLEEVSGPKKTPSNDAKDLHTDVDIDSDEEVDSERYPAEPELSIENVPEELRNDADIYKIDGALKGEYYIAVVDGSIKKYLTKPLKTMFFVLRSEHKSRSVFVQVKVDEELRVIYVSQLEYKRHQQEFATTVLMIRR